LGRQIKMFARDGIRGAERVNRFETTAVRN